MASQTCNYILGSTYPPSFPLPSLLRHVKSVVWWGSCMYSSLSLSTSFLLSSSLHVTLYPKSSFSQPQKTPSNSLFSNAQQAPPPPQNPFLGVYIITSQFLSILTSYESLRCKPNLSSFSSGLFSPLHPSTRVCILWLPYVYNYGKLPSFSSFSDRLSHIKSKGICVMSLIRRVFFFLCVSTRRAS